MESGLLDVVTLTILIIYLTLNVYRLIMTYVGAYIITKHDLQVTFRNKHSELSNEEQSRLNYSDTLTRWIIIKSTSILASIGVIYIVGHCLLGLSI